MHRPSSIALTRTRGYLFAVVSSLLVLLSCGGDRKSEGLATDPERPPRSHAAIHKPGNEKARSGAKLQTRDDLFAKAEEIARISDTKERFDRLRGLVRQAAADGLFVEAMELARSSTGLGGDRLLLFDEIFGASPRPIEELIGEYRNLTDLEDRLGAALGMGSSGRFGTTIEELPPINFEIEGLSASLLNSLLQHSGISQDLAIPSRFDKEKGMQALGILSGLLDQGRIAESTVAEAIRKVAFLDAGTAFEFVRKGELDFSRPDLEKAASAVVKSAALERPEEVLGYTLKAEFEGLPRFAIDAFDAWMHKDSAAALAWLAENRSSLAPDRLNAFSVSQALYSARRDNFSQAWTQLATIDDAELRRKAEGEVWQRERDLVRKEVVETPAVTIQSLISGQSQHQDYWIEEAMMTWISKEPEKAEDWYQKNWNSLPPAKSQYVAAAYAKNALGLGDTATARQWSNLIQDSKTRERIEASITKAEAGINP